MILNYSANIPKYKIHFTSKVNFTFHHRLKSSINNPYLYDLYWLTSQIFLAKRKSCKNVPYDTETRTGSSRLFPFRLEYHWEPLFGAARAFDLGLRGQNNIIIHSVFTRYRQRKTRLIVEDGFLKRISCCCNEWRRGRVEADCRKQTKTNS